MTFYVRRDHGGHPEYFVGVDEDGLLHTCPTFFDARAIEDRIDAETLVAHLADAGLAGFYVSEVLLYGLSANLAWDAGAEEWFDMDCDPARIN